MSVGASRAPSDTTQKPYSGDTGASSEAGYVAPKVSVSYAWEDEEHMFATALRVELANFPRIPMARP